MTEILTWGAYTRSPARKILPKLGESDVLYEIDDKVRPMEDLGQVRRATFGYGLREGDLEAIDRFVQSLLGEIWMVEGFDFSAHRGVPLARAAVKDALGTVITVKNALCAARLFEVEKPSRVYVGDGVGFLPEVWLREADCAGVAVEVLHPDPALAVDSEWRPLRGKSESIVDKCARGLRQMLRSRGSVGGPGEVPTERPLVALTSPQDERVFAGLPDDWFRTVSWPELAGPIRPHLVNRTERGRARSIFGARWKELRENREFRARFRCAGVDLWPHLKSWIESVFTRRFPEYAGMLARARYRFRSCSPHIITVWPFYSPDVRLAAIAARESGTSTLLLQHEWSGGAGFKNRPPPPMVDRIICWGELSRRGYEEAEASIYPITTAGYPPLKERRDRFDAQLGSIESGAGRTVLFADQYFQPTRARGAPLDMTVTHIDAVIAAARELPHLNFLIKFHPKTGIDEWHERFDAVQRRVNRIRAASLENVQAVPLASSLDDLLQEIEIFVTYYSTGAIEAMLAHRPVVFLNCTGRPARWPGLDARNGPAKAASVEEFVEVLEAIFHDGDVREATLDRQERHLEEIFSSSPPYSEAIRSAVDGARRPDRSQ